MSSTRGLRHSNRSAADSTGDGHSSLLFISASLFCTVRESKRSDGGGLHFNVTHELVCPFYHRRTPTCAIASRTRRALKSRRPAHSHRFCHVSRWAALHNIRTGIGVCSQPAVFYLQMIDLDVSSFADLHVGYKLATDGRR